MINLYDALLEQIEKGLKTKDVTIPFSIEKLNWYLSLSPNTMYTLAGMSGSGKSTTIQSFFILDLLDWWVENKDKTDLKLSIIYFGMERKMFMYAAKWVSRMLFIKEGKNISYKRILGRDRDNKLSEEELSDVLTYMEEFKKWQEDETLICFEGSVNPTGISKYIEEFARKHGEIIPKGDGVLDIKTYKPHHPNHLVFIITDHLGLLRPEKVEGVKKQNIDKYSQVVREARDCYSFSVVNVQQMNRSVSDVNRIKLNDTSPKLSDLADTSTVAQDSDVVLAILDPWSVLPVDVHKDVAGYHLPSLKDDRGAKFYRTLHILKNSFDSNSINLPLAFHPYTGILKAMPKSAEDMTEEDYRSIVSGAWFLK